MESKYQRSDIRNDCEREKMGETRGGEKRVTEVRGERD